MTSSAKGSQRPALEPVLDALGRELARMADVAVRLQGLPNLSTESIQASQAQIVQDIQALDGLTQSLFALADFVSALAPTVTAQSSCDLKSALNLVTLSDVARRLDSDAGPDPEHEAGALELFGDDL